MSDPFDLSSDEDDDDVQLKRQRIEDSDDESDFTPAAPRSGVYAHMLQIMLSETQSPSSEDGMQAS